MTEYDPIASHRLSYQGEYRDVDPGVREFMRTLCDLEADLLEFETEISNQDLGITGWTATRNLTDLESEHNGYVVEINSAFEAVVRGRPTLLDRYTGDKHHHRTKQYVYQHLKDFHKMVRRLEKISDRIGRRIDAKRNSANTRLVLSVSVVAVVVSLIALVSGFV